MGTQRRSDITHRQRLHLTDNLLGLLAERLQEQLDLLVIIRATRMMLSSLLGEVHSGEVVVYSRKE